MFSYVIAILKEKRNYCDSVVLIYITCKHTIKEKITISETVNDNNILILLNLIDEYYTKNTYERAARNLFECFMIDDYNNDVTRLTLYKTIDPEISITIMSDVLRRYHQDGKDYTMFGNDMYEISNSFLNNIIGG